MLIAYCDKCGFRVPESDLESGAANQVGENTYVCAKCASTATPKKPGTKSHNKISSDAPTSSTSGRRASGAIRLPNLQAESSPAQARPGSGPIKLPPAPAATASRLATVHKSARREGQTNNVPIIGAAIGAAVLLLIVIVASSGRDTAEKKTKKDPTVAPQPGTVISNASNSGRTPNTTVTTPPVTHPPVTAAPEETPADKQVSILETAERLKKADKEMEAIRNAQAAKSLAEIKTWYASNKNEILKYKNKLSALVDKNRSTPAATEAAKIIDELQIPDDTNLALDPGFESGKWGAWESWGATTFGKDAAQAKSGKLYALLGKGKLGVGQTLKGLTPNGKYVLSAWVKTFEGASVYVGVKEHGLAEVNKLVRDDSYQRVVVPFTMGAKSSAMIYAYKDEGGPVHVDDFSVMTESAHAAAVASTPPTTPNAAPKNDPAPKNQDASTDIQPGLWVGNFLPVDNDGLKSKFRLFKCARITPKLSAPYVSTSPDPSIKTTTNFGTKITGLLRIFDPGKYRFRGKGDDTLIMTINGTKVLDSDNKDEEGEISLSRGDHPIKLLHTQDHGKWGYSVRWKPPGTADWQDIPLESLWHDPRQLDVYKQLE